jgi:glycosyltransferase involved in cell wall biosynthesis
MMYNGKTVTLVVPALNEGRDIGGVLDSIPEFIDSVVVIDDGSTDDTADVARGRGAEVISHGRNRGVGAAFDTGRRRVLAMRSDIMVNMDGDGQFAPADIAKLVGPVAEGEAEFVTASRFKDPDLYPDMSRMKFVGNRMMSCLISRLTGRRFHDVSCGFRAYSRAALLRLNLFGEFTYTQETFLEFAFKDVTILEVPVEVRGTREHGRSRVASNLFRYTWQTLKIIVRTMRDYKPLRLFAGVSTVLLVAGLVPAVFLAVHYGRTGSFTPHKWAGFLAGFLFIISAMSFLLGFILDMFARMRINQEEILAILRKRE